MIKAKIIGSFLFALLCTITVTAQIGINTLNPDQSAALDISSLDKGILIPRVDTSDVTLPIATGLMIFQGSDNRFYYYDGSKWEMITPASTVKPFDKIVDADGNTSIQVESTPNDDIIRFDIAGEEKFSIQDNGEGTTYINLSNSKSNVAVGHFALGTNVSGSQNIAFGYYPLFNNIEGSFNVAMGQNALRANTDGSSNIAIGSLTLSDNTTGDDNVAIGSATLAFNDIGYNNVAIGNNSMYNNTGGYENIGIGYRSLWKNTAGDLNIGMGKEALSENDIGNQNVGFGYRSLYKHVGGDHNTALGTQALFYHEDGNGNVAIGHNAFRNNKTGVKNVGIGFTAGHGELGSEKLYIENSTADSTAALIYGDFKNDFLRLNGNTEIYASDNDASFNDFALKVGHYRFGLQLFHQDPDNNPADANWELYVVKADQALKLFKGGAGRGEFDPVSGAYTSLSDSRLKENILPLNNVLSEVNKLEPVRYNFIHDENKSGQIGFIAQDVEKLFPEFVSPPDPTSDRSDNYSMDYSGLSVVAIAAIQEQQVFIQTQQNAIEAQQIEVENLKRMNNSLQEQLTDQSLKMKKMEDLLHSILIKED